jgi:hypothetical protein
MLMALVAGVVPGCATDAVVVSPTSFYAAYTPTVLNYAATHGGMLVEVAGSPFDAPRPELERAIVGAMTGSHFGPAVAFVTTPPEDFASPYRVVLVFDAAPAYSDHTLCGAALGVLEARTEDPLRVHAALCAGSKPLTTLRGQVSGVAGPEDPRFHALIRQITLNLLPPYNPDRRDSNRRFLIPI